MKSDLVMDDIEPVFVVGHPYSGTTLVQLLITAHPAFTSGPETHFFHHVLKPLPDWSHSRLSQDQLDLVFQRLAAKPGIQLGEDTEIRIRQKAGIDGIAPAALLNELMMHFAEQAGGASRRWVEKTPRHALYIGQILTMFPRAKVINVVRDPRDVVSSTLRSRTFDSELDRRRYCAMRAEKWNREVTAAIQGMSSHQQCVTIRYDDIIANPLESLEGIMQFLNEECYPESLDTFSESYESVVTPEEDRHKNLASVGEIVDRRGIWRTRMSQNDARVVELICSDLMHQFGYVSRKRGGASLG